MLFNVLQSLHPRMVEEGSGKGKVREEKVWGYPRDPEFTAAPAPHAGLLQKQSFGGFCVNNVRFPPASKNSQDNGFDE